MSVRKISEIGSKVIRSRAKELRMMRSPRVRKLITDLTQTMRHEGLVGIAAPQIGVGRRIFITEVRKTPLRKNVSQLDPLRVFINPRIVKTSKNLVGGYEGCGSVASGGLFGSVKRPSTVSIRAFNEKGEKFECTASGLLGRIIQHEVDHLNGVCFIDKVTNTKGLLGRQEYIKMRKREQR